jgi:site-specific DNA recombinase
LGLTTKARVSKKGRKVGGRSWDKNTVHRVLTNPLFVGKVRSADGQLHPGEHKPLVTLEAFEAVATSMKERTTGRVRKNRKPEYFLTGLLRCGPCDAAMTSALGTGRKGRRYRYYRCVHQQTKGGRCPTGLLVADEVEAAVVTQVKEIAARGDVRQRILDRFFSDSGALAAAEAAHAKLAHRIQEKDAESKCLLDSFSAAGGGGGKTLAKRLGLIETETDHLRIKIGVVEERLRALRDAREQVERVSSMLDNFEALWKQFTMEERRELLHLLIQRVVVDFGAGGLRIDFHDVRLPSAAAPAEPSEPVQEATP